MTYNQAWHLKEKAKEPIYGAPRESYMFVPWLCHRLREINPGPIAEYISHEGHFMQLFIAHAFSIQGFIKGCQPVLAIDSCHLRGPYKGALLSAIAYDGTCLITSSSGMLTFTCLNTSRISDAFFIPFFPCKARGKGGYVRFFFKKHLLRICIHY